MMDDERQPTDLMAKAEASFGVSPKKEGWTRFVDVQRSKLKQKVGRRARLRITLNHLDDQFTVTVHIARSQQVVSGFKIAKYIFSVAV